MPNFLYTYIFLSLREMRVCAKETSANGPPILWPSRGNERAPTPNGTASSDREFIQGTSLQIHDP
jgi:hypothetical protein